MPARHAGSPGSFVRCSVDVTRALGRAGRRAWYAACSGRGDATDLEDDARGRPADPGRVRIERLTIGGQGTAGGRTGRTAGACTGHDTCRPARARIGVRGGPDRPVHRRPLLRHRRPRRGSARVGGRGPREQGARARAARRPAGPPAHRGQPAREPLAHGRLGHVRLRGGRRGAGRAQPVRDVPPRRGHGDRLPRPGRVLRRAHLRRRREALPDLDRARPGVHAAAARRPRWSARDRRRSSGVRDPVPAAPAARAGVRPLARGRRHALGQGAVDGVARRPGALAADLVLAGHDPRQRLAHRRLGVVHPSRHPGADARARPGRRSARRALSSLRCTPVWCLAQWHAALDRKAPPTTAEVERAAARLRGICGDLAVQWR